METDVQDRSRERELQELSDLVLALSSTVENVTRKVHKNPNKLKPIHIEALKIIHHHGIIIVGDIQRILGLRLPAQMSRIIRKLKNRKQPLIVGRTLDTDRRKIGVRLTMEGENVLITNQEHLRRAIAALLAPHTERPEGQSVMRSSLTKLIHLLANGSPIALYKQNGDGEE